MGRCPGAVPRDPLTGIVDGARVVALTRANLPVSLGLMDPGRWAKGVDIPNPGRPAPWLVGLARAVAPLVRLAHRPTLEGIEHLPREGPFLLVANHSGGIGQAEILSLLVLYLERVGADRPLAGFAFPSAFAIFPLSRLLRALGAIPSTYAAAHAALDRRVPLLVFPGGDHETLRPLWQAHRVTFGGRVGFLRIAHARSLPIVPLGIRGGHFTAPILFPSRALATLLVLPRLVGLKRWGVSLLGVLGLAVVSFAAPWSWPIKALVSWAWLASPLPFVAWIPWKIQMRIGAPLTPDRLFAGDDDDGRLRGALERVERAVQSLVDARSEDGSPGTNGPSGH